MTDIVINHFWWAIYHRSRFLLISIGAEIEVGDGGLKPTPNYTAAKVNRELTGVGVTDTLAFAQRGTYRYADQQLFRSEKGTGSHWASIRRAGNKWVWGSPPKMIIG